ncbi:hypothetical protein G816_04705, partial [Escherichia coli HVH 158 (4-3224287)]
MSSSLPDDINALKRLLAEQEALNRALLEKLNEREREIDHLQAQLDKLRKLYGVGPVCSELHIAPSTYYHCQQQRHHPDKRSARAQRDDWLKKEIL